MSLLLLDEPKVVTPALPPIVDLRGKLPTISQWKGTPVSYRTRDVGGLAGCTIHYTAGPTTSTAPAIAQYQTSEAAEGQPGNDPPTPFPGIAYSYLVDGKGVPNLCHDLNVRVWHSDGPGRNSTYVGICYTGSVRPTAVQIKGIAAAILDARQRSQRPLPFIEGHKDGSSTACPGPLWPGWRSEVEAFL